MPTNNRLNILALFASAAVTLLAPLTARATLMEAASFDQKVEAADAIVVGTCVKTHSERDPNGRGILTYSTFRVSKALKGQQVPELTIVTPGGQVGNIRQETIGVPTFREGQENVIFVRGSAAGPTVLFFDQGAYDVVAEGGEKVVKPVPSGAVKIDTQRGVAVAAEEPLPMARFESQVRETSKRVAHYRMEMLKERERKNSIVGFLGRNKWLVILALAGAALATWQLLRR